MEDNFEFDGARVLSAFSMGAPGKRTFFLAIGEKDKWVRVWLEKYLLDTLGAAIDQFLATLYRENLPIKPGLEGNQASDDKPSGLPYAELEIDQLSLGYDNESATMNMIVHSLGPDRKDDLHLDCLVTISQLENLGRQSKKICAAGRPICSICGNPIDPSGHVCPGRN